MAKANNNKSHPFVSAIRLPLLDHFGVGPLNEHSDPSERRKRLGLIARDVLRPEAHILLWADDLLTCQTV